MRESDRAVTSSWAVTRPLKPSRMVNSKPSEVERSDESTPSGPNAPMPALIAAMETQLPVEVWWNGLKRFATGVEVDGVEGVEGAEGVVVGALSTFFASRSTISPTW